MNIFKNSGVFVMPCYSNSEVYNGAYMDKAINSIFNQSDPNWNIVIVDDNSPNKDIIKHLDKIKSRAPEKIHIIKKQTHGGPGDARNAGIKWAYENNFPFILFLDSDDVAHPRRLEVVKEVMEKDTLISVVYSTFRVIDENDKEVRFEKLTNSIKEILEGHVHPAEGFNSWIDMGTKNGYTNLTSTTNVRTSLAYKYQFPKEKVSEDFYTWFQYSAGGGKFKFCSEIFSLYRIPQNVEGSSSRSSYGRNSFYKNKCRVDSLGFLKAIELGIENGKINRKDKNELVVKFYLKLAETMEKENCFDLANEQVKKAKEIDIKLFEKFSKKLKVLDFISNSKFGLQELYN